MNHLANAEFESAEFESTIAQTARLLPYPSTPPIATAVARRLARRPIVFLVRSPRWIMVGLIMLAAILSVPPVRAALIDFIQIGVVRIGLRQPPATPSPLPATPVPSPTPKRSLLPLAGETTLEEAQRQLPWPIPLPTYPPDLGEPDAVFLQSLGGKALVLVWMDPLDPARVRLSLHLLEADILVWKKVAVEVVQETTVHNQPAFWTAGPYLLETKRQGINTIRLIEGHVLIWTADGITYRLESDLPLEEAVKIAESLR